jgi:hypothetical protein
MEVCMAGDEVVGARPDDDEKPTPSAKKSRPKSRASGPKVDSDVEPAGDATDTADSSSDEETPAPDSEATKPVLETLAAEPDDPVPAKQEAPGESKPKSLIHLLRFERRVGKRRP